MVTIDEDVVLGMKVYDLFDLLLRTVENNGYYIDDSLAIRVENSNEKCNSSLDTLGKEERLLFEPIESKLGKYDTIMVISGKHFPFPNNHPRISVPYVQIFITDCMGVVAQYQIKYYLKEVAKQIYAPHKVQLIWERKKSK